MIDETRDLEQEVAALRERLARLERELRQLRRFARQARPVDVPTLTAALHLLEAIAAGDRAMIEFLSERVERTAVQRGGASPVHAL